MWELVNRFSHGRYPVRRILLLAITGLMTFLVASLALNAPVYADDATRSGDTVTYQNNIYTKITDPAKELPPAVASQTPTPSGYKYLDESGKKAYFILTVGDPAKANAGNYVVYDFTSEPEATFSNPSPPKDITFVAEDTNGDMSAGEAVGQCSDSSLTGIGWWICPTANFIAVGMDKIYGIIADFLVVRTVTTNTDGPLFQMWAVIRDIANICFVIALLIIVYSQLTSIGISNYGLKKTLPRLIIAAILVNISFWLCTIAVDASNILGYSIHNMFMGLVDRFSTGAGYNNSMPNWENITYIALGGTGVLIGGLALLNTGVTAAPFLLLPFLVGGLLAVLVALIVLAARQALITILIIIAPLAFVAYVLPNTEKWFTKWRETLTTMLLLFPIFSVIFSGAQLAGVAIIQSAGGNIFTVILGLATQVAPIVITPLLVKFSGGLIGKIAGIVNNPNKGLVDRTRNWAQGAAQERKNKILSDQTRMAKSKRFGRLARNPITAATKGLNNYSRYRDGRRKAYESMAENSFAATKYGQRVETMNRDAANDKKDIENRYMRSDEGRRTEIRSRHLDIDKTETENDLMRSNAGKYITYRQGMAEVDKTRVHNEFEEHHFGHQLDEAKRKVELQKKTIENTHQANWDNKLRTDAGLLKLDLDVKASEVSAAKAKEKLEKMHSEIVAQGHESEHILNLRGVDAQTQAGMLNIAHDIRKDTLESAMAQTAKAMAERKITENKTAAIKENIIEIDGKKIREYGAGIMEVKGERSIEAKAKSENSAATIEDVKNIRSTMDHELATNPAALRAKFDGTNVFSEKVAYAIALGKAGTPGMRAFRTLLSDLGDGVSNGAFEDTDMFQTFKEFVAGESDLVKAGKDIETFVYNKPDANNAPMTFKELRDSADTWVNMTPVAFASMSEVAQEDALNLLRVQTPNDAYWSIINAIRGNTTANGSIKQKVRETFSIYSDDQIRSAAKRGKTLPPPGTYVP